jgi:hypothetical protein
MSPECVHTIGFVAPKKDWSTWTKETVAQTETKVVAVAAGVVAAGVVAAGVAAAGATTLTKTTQTKTRVQPY